MAGLSTRKPNLGTKVAPQRRQSRRCWPQSTMLLAAGIVIGCSRDDQADKKAPTGAQPEKKVPNQHASGVVGVAE